MNTPTPLLIAVQTLFNQALRMDEESRARLRAMAGKTIGIHLDGLGWAFQIGLHDGTVEMRPGGEEADTILRGAPFSLLRSAASGDREGVFKGDVTVEGDVDLGRRFQELLQGLDIDWEEQLSHYLGDVVAHQLGNAVRGGRQWFETVVGTLIQDGAEFLREEKRDVPARFEVDEFLRGVDELRSDVDRLEQRIARLARHVGES